MRTRKSQKRYIQDGFNSKECPFCGIKEKEPRKIHEEKAYFYRVENIFGYDIWDDHIVSEHEMIVPKRHITSLAEITDEEGLEYLQLIKAAEANGYCIYSRGVDGPTKSVPHFHTHLIKLNTSKRIRQYLYIQKPHVVLFRTSSK